MLSKCPRCKGIKIIRKIGMIQGPCDVCDATGFVSVKELVKSAEKVSETVNLEKSKVETKTDNEPETVDMFDATNTVVELKESKSAKGKANAKKDRQATS